MLIVVNVDKLKHFILDNSGKLRSPMYLEEEVPNEKAKNIFKSIAEYCLKNNINKISKETFFKLLMNGIDDDVVTSVTSLAKKGYICIDTSSDIETAEGNYETKI